MIQEIIARWKQGYRTVEFPSAAVALPDRFRGVPVIDYTRCPPGCNACREACPTRALAIVGNNLQLDLGRCLFCPECERACPQQAIRFSREYRLARKDRDKLVIGGAGFEPDGGIDEKIQTLFGRSLKLRQVSAAGCNACEADVNVLSTIVFDLGRFGIQVVASPRHADGLLVTGPVSQNMKSALLKTYEAIPAPRIVIAMGACSISGGLYAGHEEVNDGVGGILPVDLFIPGCPPHPFTILDGLLKLLGKNPALHLAQENVQPRRPENVSRS